VYTQLTRHKVVYVDAPVCTLDVCPPYSICIRN